MLTEAEVGQQVIDESRAGRGGWVATPNIGVCRHARRNLATRDLGQGATLVVPDGMSLMWAARLRGAPLAERVIGPSLIFSLSSAAASAGLLICPFGGNPSVPGLAGTELVRRCPGLRVAEADAPPVGLDELPEGVVPITKRLTETMPDIVYVGLGLPKQKRLIAELAPALPGTWFMSCGVAIPFAAGTLSHTPTWIQRSGLEWLFRLLIEPRRLFRRYLVHDAPYAARLLI